RSARFIVLWSGPVASVHETLHFSRYVEEHGIPPTLERLSSGELVSMPRPQPGDFGFRDTDPRFHLSRLSVPGLWLFGERDTSIPVELSTERLAGMRASGQKLLEYQVI